MVTPPAIAPGSAPPADAERVEALLRLVPFVAFEPELERCLRDRLAEGVGDGIDALWESDVRERLVAALDRVEARAVAEANGGLGFLARTSRHFLTRQPVRSREHPLLVALYLRVQAGLGSADDHPRAIGDRMDEW
jgi:hypothetical protein